jgi:hypothetical protein
LDSNDLFLILFYAAMVRPSLLMVKETIRRAIDLKAGLKSLVLLPLTIGGLVAYILCLQWTFSLRSHCLSGRSLATTLL